MIVASIDPGVIAQTRVRVRRGRKMLAGVACHGLDSLPALIEDVASRFEVDRWEVEVNAFQAVVLQHAPTMEVCRRLGIRFELKHVARSA